MHEHPEILSMRVKKQEQKRIELVDMLVFERERIGLEGPGADLTDLNLGVDDSVNTAIVKASASTLRPFCVPSALGRPRPA